MTEWGKAIKRLDKSINKGTLSEEPGIKSVFTPPGFPYLDYKPKGGKK